MEATPASNRLKLTARRRPAAYARLRPRAVAQEREPELLDFVSDDLGQFSLGRAHGEKGTNEKVDGD